MYTKKLMKTVKCRSSSCQINYVEKFTLYETLRNYRPPWNERGALIKGRWRKIDQEWEFSRAAVYTSSINREIHLSIELRVYSGGWTRKLFSTADDLRDFTRERSSKESRKTAVKFYDRKEGNGGCVKVISLIGPISKQLPIRFRKFDISRIFRCR